jgi:hypothetical protein
MNARRSTIAAALAATIWLALASSLGASDELIRAKELYRSAAYDEALTLLDSLPAGGDPADAMEAREYRVFCLVALDRKDDARKAMAALISADPLYTMSETEASPRVRAMFTEVRRSILPGIVQRAYADAKTLFDKKDPRAAAEFDRVLLLLADPDVKGNPGLSDLSTVAIGFRDLSKALAAAPPPPVDSLSGTAPRPEPVLVAPVVLSQPVPIPQIREEREWDGEVEVTINANGRVIAARMTKPIQPVYDQQLVRAAMQWTYRPALRDGVPTSYVKQISVHVDTRPECSVRAAGPCRPAAPSR